MVCDMTPAVSASATLAAHSAVVMPRTPRAARHGVTTLQPMPTLSEAVTDSFQPPCFPLPGRRDVSATWARGASYPLVAGHLSGECDGGALRQTRLSAAFSSRNAFSPAS